LGERKKEENRLSFTLAGGVGGTNDDNLILNRGGSDVGREEESGMTKLHHLSKGVKRRRGLYVLRTPPDHAPSKKKRELWGKEGIRNYTSRLRKEK